jgi:hypothetical protein
MQLKPFQVKAALLKNSVHNRYYQDQHTLAFTPNGDCKNDVVKALYVQDISNVHFTVFSSLYLQLRAYTNYRMESLAELSGISKILRGLLR